MKIDDIKLDQIVRLKRQVFGMSIGLIPAGSTGTVIAVFPDADQEAGEPIAHVLMEEHHPSLDEWDNLLYVFSKYGDVDVDDFEALT